MSVDRSEKTRKILTHTAGSRIELKEESDQGEPDVYLDGAVCGKGNLARRDFLKLFGVGAIVPWFLLPSQFSSAATVSMLPAQEEIEDLILVMQRDLARTISKGAGMQSWGMVIDLRKCVGCKACTVACVAENKLPPGVVYRPVIDEEVGTYPNVSRRFLPRPCMHCDDPPCVAVCPVGATTKRQDGIVDINYENCIGCRYCITACPYNARTFDFGEDYNREKQPYELLASREYGGLRKRREGVSPVGNARKCHFCVHKLAGGQLPACVSTCIGRATYFGDMSDPESLVAKLSGHPNVMHLKEELGTKPRVHYLT